MMIHECLCGQGPKAERLERDLRNFLTDYQELKAFIDRILQEDPSKRPTAQELIDSPFLKNAEDGKTAFVKLIRELLNKKN